MCIVHSSARETIDDFLAGAQVGEERGSQGTGTTMPKKAAKHAAGWKEDEYRDHKQSSESEEESEEESDDDADDLAELEALELAELEKLEAQETDDTESESEEESEEEEDDDADDLAELERLEAANKAEESKQTQVSTSKKKRGKRQRIKGGCKTCRSIQWKGVSWWDEHEQVKRDYDGLRPIDPDDPERMISIYEEVWEKVDGNLCSFYRDTDIILHLDTESKLLSDRGAVMPHLKTDVCEHRCTTCNRGRCPQMLYDLKRSGHDFIKGWEVYSRPNQKIEDADTGEKFYICSVCYDRKYGSDSDEEIKADCKRLKDHFADKKKRDREGPRYVDFDNRDDHPGFEQDMEDIFGSDWEDDSVLGDGSDSPAAHELDMKSNGSESDGIEYVTTRINKVKYYVEKDNPNSKIYKITDDGDVGVEVGEMVNGEKKLYGSDSDVNQDEEEEEDENDKRNRLDMIHMDEVQSKLSGKATVIDATGFKNGTLIDIEGIPCVIRINEEYVDDNTQIFDPKRVLDGEDGPYYIWTVEREYEIATIHTDGRVEWLFGGCVGQRGEADDC